MSPSRQEPSNVKIPQDKSELGFISTRLVIYDRLAVANNDYSISSLDSTQGLTIRIVTIVNIMNILILAATSQYYGTKLSSTNVSLSTHLAAVRRAFSASVTFSDSDFLSFSSSATWRFICLCRCSCRFISDFASSKPWHTHDTEDPTTCSIKLCQANPSNTYLTTAV